MGFIIVNDSLVGYTEEPGVTEVVIPDGVTKIGDNAFEECMTLTAVTIPDGVRKIGTDAFANCTGLTSVTIPDSVTEIGLNAFENCIGLTSVTIPDSVEEIGIDAFIGCTGLTSVTIPNHIKELGVDAFADCKSVNFCDMTFWDDPEGELALEYVLLMVRDMIRDRQYDMEIHHWAKHMALWQLFCRHPDDAELFAYIEAHFAEMFQTAIDTGNANVVVLVCQHTSFLTEQNIDRFLERAIAQKQTEIQLLLLNYKNEKIGYSKNQFKL